MVRSAEGEGLHSPITLQTNGVAHHSRLSTAMERGERALSTRTAPAYTSDQGREPTKPIHPLLWKAMLAFLWVALLLHVH